MRSVAPPTSRQRVFAAKQYVYLALLCVPIVIILLVRTFSAETDVVPQSFHPQTHTPSRLDQYCTIKVKHGVEAHSFGAKELFELDHLLLTIRHGDRSRIHTFPNSVPSATTSVSSFLDNDIAHNMDPLGAMKLEIIASKTPAAARGESLVRALDPAAAFKTPDWDLGQGQLTSRGFMQHVSLGAALRGAYKSFLDGLRGTDQLYVRSTNYVRTVQSVAALLSKLLPESLLESVSRVAIKVFEAEGDEVMHGVGLRASSHPGADGKAEQEVLGSCAAAVRLAVAQRSSFEKKSRVYNDLAGLFGSGAVSAPVTDLVDASMPLYCHARPLPCANATKQGRMRSRGGCLAQAQLAELMVEADRFYCRRFAGQDGGLQATQLAFYPFFSEIVERLWVADERVRLTVFSGHDTVIAPLLAVLGVYDQQGLCAWPGYASRVVFELHRPRPEAARAADALGLLARLSAAANSSQAPGPATTAAPPLLPADTRFVRIMFNGRDVTPLVPRCRQARAELLRALAHSPAGEASARDVALLDSDSPLCPLPALREALRDLVAPHNSLAQACGGPSLG